MGQECAEDNIISEDLRDLSELCIETNQTEIDCSGLELERFTVSDVWQQGKVQILRLNNNKLTEIPDLSSFTQLLELDLSHNRISKVAAHAFVGLSKLQILNMEMNAELILSNTTVSSTGFRSLRGLQVLRYLYFLQQHSILILQQHIV